MKRFLLAPDSFKGTMSAQEICSIWEAAILRHIPDAQVRSFPMADGGEGMVDAFLRICGGEQVIATVSGPFGEPLEAAYGRLPNGTAVIEMAACAGLPLAHGRLDPMHATTYGVGQLLLHAAQHGAKQAILGLGGSATNDCGIGMAAALGYAFFDAQGNAVNPYAENMSNICKVVPPTSLPALTVTAACDVDNPLYGPSGATYTFGMQKGATDETLPILDAGLQNLASVLQRDLHVEVSQVPGSGAAGGLGAGVFAFLKGSLKPGIDLLLDAAGFDEALAQADMVFTGEGRIDWQSAHGKVPVGISRRAQRHHIPCIALCGAIGKGVEAVYPEGITAVFSAVRGACTFEDIKATCHDDMALLIDNVLRVLLL